MMSVTILYSLDLFIFLFMLIHMKKGWYIYGTIWSKIVQIFNIQIWFISDRGQAFINQYDMIKHLNIFDGGIVRILSRCFVSAVLASILFSCSAAVLETLLMRVALEISLENLMCWRTHIPVNLTIWLVRAIWYFQSL